MGCRALVLYPIFGALRTPGPFGGRRLWGCAEDSVAGIIGTWLVRPPTSPFLITRSRPLVKPAVWLTDAPMRFGRSGRRLMYIAAAYDSPNAEDVMRHQELDGSVHVSCGNCTACCDQPWRTMIDTEKARVLDAHDFGQYPQLVGKAFYRSTSGDAAGRYELAKGEGTRCLFLDTDGLCIIHKELGPDAKPDMCLQFPFLSARTWTCDRVSANFGCPSVQADSGPLMTEQSEAVAETVPLSKRPVNADAPVMFDMRVKLTQAEEAALFDRAIGLFGDAQDRDVWGDFAELLALARGVEEWKATDTSSSGDLVERLRSSDSFGDVPDSPGATSFDRPSVAPMPARLLFAATLYPDTVPADAAGGLGFVRRLTLIPKLMSLATMSGGYASRLLGRNVSMVAVMGHELDATWTPEATALVRRYFRSRLWQRRIAGTKLPIVGGFHQHVCDLNAIVFFARAEAAACSVRRLDEGLISGALRRVEFHLANQIRLSDHTLKGWFRSRLCDLGLASVSLALFAPVSVPHPAGCVGSVCRLQPSGRMV